jgi:predicted nucleic acid-binding protein
MKENKAFLDTNILVYAYDASAGNKHDIAKKIVTELWNSGLGCLSTQVLQEFFVTITKKIQKPLNNASAYELIKDLLKWDVIINTGQCILDGIELQKKYKYSFWDSMIIQAAVKSKSDILLSEDLSNGQIVDGVEIRNPFVMLGQIKKKN